MGDAKRRQELDPNWNKLKIEPTAIGTYELSLKNPYPFLELQGCCLVPVARLGYEEKGYNKVIQSCPAVFWVY